MRFWRLFIFLGLLALSTFPVLAAGPHTFNLRVLHNGKVTSEIEIVEPVHRLLVRKNAERLRYFPAHPHEGAVEGNALAESTFHHFANYNWDTSAGCPSCNLAQWL